LGNVRLAALAGFEASVPARERVDPLGGMGTVTEAPRDSLKIVARLYGGPRVRSRPLQRGVAANPTFHRPDEAGSGRRSARGPGQHRGVACREDRGCVWAIAAIIARLPLDRAPAYRAIAGTIGLIGRAVPFSRRRVCSARAAVVVNTAEAPSATTDAGHCRHDGWRHDGRQESC
jgi:hypothetical protein